jgi:hypothetical protein
LQTRDASALLTGPALEACSTCVNSQRRLWLSCGVKILSRCVTNHVEQRKRVFPAHKSRQHFDWTLLKTRTNDSVITSLPVNLSTKRQNVETRVCHIYGCCDFAKYCSRGAASGNKLKMTLGLPVYVRPRRKPNDIFADGSSGATINCCDNSGARSIYIISVKGIGARLNRLPAAGVGMWGQPCDRVSRS